MAGYVGPGFPVSRVAIIPSTIDPLSPENAMIDLGEARAIVARFGVDVNRPLLLQVSRFDPWKDPRGIPGEQRGGVRGEGDGVAGPPGESPGARRARPGTCATALPLHLGSAG